MAGGARFRSLRVAVSGATGGIGRAVAARFAREGAKLVLIDRDGPVLEQLAVEIGEASVIVCDQTVDRQIEAAANAAGAIDIFINNAGIMIRKPLLEMTPGEITSLFEVNAVGSIKMAIAFGRGMVARGSGTIVNVSSQHAFVGAAGRGIYAATKAAIVQFTRTAGVEWAGSGVRVVGIAPGPVVSPMTADAMRSDEYRSGVVARMPIGRFLEAGEIAEAIMALSEPGLSSVVGQTLLSDGGGTLA